MISDSLIDLIKVASRVAVLTGAGISAESGIPTFRGAGGYWKNYRAEDLATPEAFARDPKLVWEWYAMRMEVCAKAEPNPGHRIVFEMEKYFSEFLLVTQNVDGLHRRAGNQKILEMHGNIFTARCTKCRNKFSIQEIPPLELPLKCNHCLSLARPHIVWFGETYEDGIIEKALNFITKSQVLFIVGTSGQVGLPAHLAKAAIASGATAVEINPDESTLSSSVHFHIKEKSGIALPDIWKRICQIS